MQAGNARPTESGSEGGPEPMGVSEPLPRAKNRLQMRQEPRRLATGGAPLGVKVAVVPLRYTSNDPFVDKVDRAEDCSGLSDKDEGRSTQRSPIDSRVSRTCTWEAHPWITIGRLRPAGEAHAISIRARTRHLDEHRGFVVATAAHKSGRVGLLLPRPRHAETELSRPLDNLPDGKGRFDHTPVATGDTASRQGGGAQHRVLRPEPGKESAHLQPSPNRRSDVKLARYGLHFPMRRSP